MPRLPPPLQTARRRQRDGGVPLPPQPPAGTSELGPPRLPSTAPALAQKRGIFKAR